MAATDASTVSANCFASGSNPNAGNTITGRPTTRLHHAPGGAATIVLGGEQPGEDGHFGGGNSIYCQRSSKCVTQAPGGASTICLADDGMPRQSPTRVSSNAFANGASQNCGNGITDRPTTLVHQAPGGTSTICLGGNFPDGPSVGVSTARPTAFTSLPEGAVSRGVASCLDSSTAGADVVAQGGTGAAVGGPASVTLGCDDTAGLLREHEAHRQVVVETPDAVPRFTQAPGGTSTVCLGGGDSVAALASANAFAHGANQNAGNVMTGRPTTRLLHAPGGASTLCLGCDDTVTVAPAVAVRGAVGGESTVVLGSDNAQEMYRERQAAREAVLETPDAQPRFQQAPGGTASISLGGDGVAAVPAPRGAVGGATTVFLGASGVQEMFGERAAAAAAAASAANDPPEAQARFTQAPGGDASISLAAAPLGSGEEVSAPPRGPPSAIACLGGAADAGASDVGGGLRCGIGGGATICLGASDVDLAQPAPSVRGPVGGEATVSFGLDDAGETLRQRAAERTATVDTPDALARFPQATGGTATISLGAAASDEMFAKRAAAAEAAAAAVAEAPAALPRFPQATGGTSTICLGATEAEPGSAVPLGATTRQAPGGTSTICLGGDGDFGAATSSNAFACGSSQNVGNYITGRSTTRLHHAPGGASTICLGAQDDVPAVAAAVDGPVRHVGGEATVVLGSDDTAAMLRRRGEQREATVETSAGAARFPQPTGGTATVSLGSDSAEVHFAARESERSVVLETPDATARFPQAPGGNSSFRLADDAPAPAPVTSRRTCPGGASTIKLGLEGCSDIEKILSAPTPQRGPVGGEATITLGIDDAKQLFDERKERLAAAVDTPEPAPRFPQAAGGTATVVLGVADHSDAFAQRLADQKVLDTPEAAPRFRKAACSGSTICLGTDEGCNMNGTKTLVEASNQMSPSVIETNAVQGDATVKTPPVLLG
eukprot:TRINITY_DN46417_c0_g1_i1.p1 TRINITY_DN46417_c0_g1~~TRINITY_DN46417_c0_g1_i1.p1  ORF type:complete len:952 (-),score=194.60 TRINITY_DN46417_c0_g1_i1:70-2925(-)